MRTIFALLLAAAVFAQDGGRNPYYNSEWEEESILSTGKDRKSGQEAKLIRIRYTADHPLNACFGASYVKAVREHPAARFFAAADTTLTARFPSGDEYHVHVIRKDGSQEVYLEENNAPIEFLADDLKDAATLVVVSSRYHVSYGGERRMLPPYAFAVSVVHGKDPISESAAQIDSHIGTTGSGATTVIEPRPFSKGEFALAVTTDPTEESFVIGVGRSMLQPRVTFDAHDAKHRQHIGIYPLPPDLVETSELDVSIGTEVVRAPGFPPVRVNVEAPDAAEALKAPVKVTTESDMPGREFSTIFVWGSMKGSRDEIKAETRIGENPAKHVVGGEAETFVFARVWSAWESSGGMLAAGGLLPVMGPPYDRVIEPPPQPYHVIDLRGSGMLESASNGLSPVLPFLAMGAIASGLGSNGDMPQVWQAPNGEIKPDQIQALAPADSQDGSRYMWQPPGPTADEKFWFALVDAIESFKFGEVAIGTSANETRSVKFQYRDGRANFDGIMKLWLPPSVADAWSFEARPLMIQEFETAVELKATFSPTKEKRYINKVLVTATNPLTGKPVNGGRVILDGTGVLPTKPKIDLTWWEDDPASFGTLHVGGSSRRDIEAEIIWEPDRTDKNKFLDVQFTLHGRSDQFKILNQKPVRVAPGKSRYTLPVLFSPNATGKYEAVLGAAWVDPKGKRIVAFGEKLRIGGTAAGKGTNDGADFQGAVYRVKIKEGTRFIPTEGAKVEKDGEKHYPLHDPDHPMSGSYYIKTEGNGYLLYTGKNPDRYRPTISAGMVPQAEDAPIPSLHTQPDTGVTVKAPPGTDPTLTSQVGEILYIIPMSQIGQLAEPGEPPVALYIAVLKPQMIGKPVEVRDGEGKKIGRFKTYSWVPKGPAEILNGLQYKMTFRRNGETNANEVVIKTTNLEITKIQGDIEKVKIGGQRGAQKITGILTSKDPELTLFFRATAAGGEGTISIEEPANQ